MNQKYIIQKDDEKNVLRIKEFAELDKEIMSLVYEQAYEWETIAEAAAAGVNAVIHVIRSQNIYPPQLYAVKMAESIREIHDQGSLEPVELVFNDLDFVTKDHPAVALIADVEEDTADIDDLLDDELDEGLEDTKSIDNASALQVSDDDMDDDDETVL